MFKRAVVVTASCAALWLGSQPQVSAQGLFAGLPSEDVGALPSRRPKTSAPEITSPIELKALRQDTYPGLRPTLIVAESVIKLVGAGFGSDAQGRIVRMKLQGHEDSYALEVVSWRDTEIRVRLPALIDLGIDAKQAVALKAQLTAKKNIAGPSLEIGIEGGDGKWVVKPKPAQLAVVYRDLDGDGHEADDCDDFDARRHPGNQEVVDPNNLDEDCNADTKAEGAVAAVDDELSL